MEFEIIITLNSEFQTPNLIVKKYSIMTKAPLYQNLPPYTKFIFFICITVVVLIITTLLGFLTAIPFYGFDSIKNMSNQPDLSNHLIIQQLKYFQMVSQMGLFIFPVILFAFLVNRNIPEYLEIKRFPEINTAVVSVILIIASLPVINWMSEVNQMLKLPESIRFIEQWMKSSEENATKVTEAFLNVCTIRGLAVNLLIVGILPAVGEEFFFRGIIQRLFKEWFKNTHVAVITAAVVFSAFHMQFYGFFPRMMLGLLLGYLFVWTKNLWVPVTVHFINNATAVVVEFLNHRKIIDYNADTIGTQANDYIYVIFSVVVTSLLLIYIYRRSLILTIKE